MRLSNAESISECIDETSELYSSEVEAKALSSGDLTVTDIAEAGAISSWNQQASQDLQTI